MSLMRSIHFVRVGILQPESTDDNYLDNDSDKDDSANRNLSSAYATPSRSSRCSSLSVSPERTPASITNELTNVGRPVIASPMPSMNSTIPMTKKEPVVEVRKRKRLLSDRGERELEYPICDYRTSRHNWMGCQFLKSRISGVGLHNSSNYCFLNSVLQSIVHTAQLARYLVETHDETKCYSARMPCLQCNLKKHILRAIQSSKAFEATWMRQFFSRIFPAHRFGHQEDAHEMLSLLLSALEPPLPAKRLQQNSMSNSAISPKSAATTSALNGLSPISALEKKGIAQRASTSAASTPIEQIFGGNLRNQITCDVCSVSYTNYEKIREVNLGLSRYGAVRITELMNDFFGMERLQCFMCKNCKCKRTAIRRTTILRAPSVLIVQLKRFNLLGGKNRLPVKTDLALNFDKFMYNNEPVSYRLNGIIEHIGAGLNFGHYISAWRGFDERSWFHFDDAEVTPILEHNLQQMEPYILFYTRTSNESDRKLDQSHLSLRR